MKRLLILLIPLLLGLSASAQPYGLVVFTNDNNSLITNGLTGMPVGSTNITIKVALYIGPDGVTDDSSLVLVTNGVPVLAGGRYNGNFRTVAPYTVSNYVTLQVRAFESAYGNNYDSAASAPPMNGRRALIGKSALGRVFLTTSSPGPTTPKVGPAVGPITVFPVDGPPVITGNDIIVSEGSNGTATATFTVRLLGAATNEVTVDFTTIDGTALAGSDYVSTNGTVVFAPGETSKSIPVTLTPDVDPEPDETFTLVLSNPVNATLLRSSILCTIAEVHITSLSVDVSITINSVSGRHYVIEKSTDAINWTPVAGATNIVATGSSLTVVDRGAGCAGLNLYRAGLVPQ